jgi:hypothetical protein
MHVGRLFVSAEVRRSDVRKSGMPVLWSDEAACGALPSFSL